MARSSHDHAGLRHLSLPLPVQAALIHLLAWGVVLGLAAFSQQFHVVVAWRWLLVAQGAIAGSLSFVLGLPGWWLAINLAFFPMIGLGQQLDLRPEWYLLALCLLLLTQFGALRSRVPLYLSSHRAKTELAHLLPHTQGLRLLDIGSGTGGLLAQLAQARPDLRLAGVESAPLLWLVSRLRLGKRADIRFGSLWRHDLSRYDVVYAFLSPEPMARLWDKVRREMKPGSLFISNSFAVPGVAPDAVIDLNDLNRGRLLLWRLS
ncbi:MAG: class I SAM-dependent methyltransferase [Hydrogenophilaceae bacterium]|nr:class I SAM-dependent methyltransferase [Hydrogenophilaceae bacterium]